MTNNEGNRMTGRGDDGGAWTYNADYWIRIIREHRDRFRSELTDAAVLEAIGACDGLTVLDAGCGEGYLTRELVRRGAARVVGVDRSPALISAATVAGQGCGSMSFKVGDIARLPLDGAAFDLVVANHVCNDVQDINAPAREFARVLRTSGQLIILMLHPCFYEPGAGRQAAPIRPVQEYFSVRAVEQHFEVDGLVSPSPAVWWMRPLEAYTEALTDAGFYLSGMREPHPSLEQYTGSSWWRENFPRPLFLLVTALKR